MTDCIIIGAGVIGCATAEYLARYDCSCVVLEAGEDVASGASKANSGIVHAGYDAKSGSLKAKYNVRGAKMYPELARRLGVPYRRNGALVVAFDQDEVPTLRKLYEQGIENGVEHLRLIDRDEIIRLEGKINPKAVMALDVPDSAVVSPYEMTIALAYHAAQCGVRFVFDSAVERISWENGVYTVNAGGSVYRARCVINCAGCASDRVRAMMSGEKIRIQPRRGEYYLLDKTETCPFSRTIFQVPGKMGKGVLVTPTAHGNTLLGPSAEDISDAGDKRTTAEGLGFVYEKCALTWPEVSKRNVITTFAGVRAHEDGGDFLIGAVPGAPGGAFEAAGIESPGLSAAPAIGEALAQAAAEFLSAAMKASVPEAVPLLKPFHEMSEAEKEEACAKNPEYGRLVCRCEEITEAEILDALRRPVPARSIDAVKRRTRAGMGRCQGGFCSPRVLEIICQETGKSPLQITKSGGQSFILTGTLKQ